MTAQYSVFWDATVSPATSAAVSIMPVVLQEAIRGINPQLPITLNRDCREQQHTTPLDVMEMSLLSNENVKCQGA